LHQNDDLKHFGRTKLSYKSSCTGGTFDRDQVSGGRLVLIRNAGLIISSEQTLLPNNKISELDADITAASRRLDFAPRLLWQHTNCV